MRHVQMLYIFLFLAGFVPMAQILPSSTGSCGVSPRGVMGCDGVGSISIGDATKQLKANVSASSPKLFVTRFVLAPGAPLSTPLEGYDNLIVGINGGQLRNELSASPIPLQLLQHGVILMPGNERYRLRNIGKENLELMVIEIRK